MGTRNLTIVKLNGKIKVAQYGQWDGYPTGQGNTIAEFLHGSYFYNLKSSLEKVKFIKQSTVAKLYDEMKSIGAENRFSYAYPELSRDTGAMILEFISKFHNLNTIGLVNEIAFLKDGLFCEWAYEIDLDKEQVTVLKGWNTGKDKKQTIICHDGSKKNYIAPHYITKAIRTYAFKEFTKEAMEKLENDMKDISNEA